MISLSLSLSLSLSITFRYLPLSCHRLLLYFGSVPSFSFLQPLACCALALNFRTTTIVERKRADLPLPFFFVRPSEPSFCFFCLSLSLLLIFKNGEPYVVEMGPDRNAETGRRRVRKKCKTTDAKLELYRCGNCPCLSKGSEDCFPSSKLVTTCYTRALMRTRISQKCSRISHKCRMGGLLLHFVHLEKKRSLWGCLIVVDLSNRKVRVIF